ncbi:hypothetical protein K501DRAFT_290645 [Backusella circina FSU 941]|nr:hypothetical protein K501DRAFT_290645 [Backusella circina FSU 941]
MLTKNQAICMFFYVDYTEENVKIYKKKIEEFEDSELCWNIREQEPILVMKHRIRGDPLTYQKYPDDNPKEKKVDKRERVELATVAQVKQFINEVYCPSQPKNNDIYLKGTISTLEIYNLVKTYTTVFHDLINSICTYLPRYQESLKNLEKNGYEIIGYARKSPTGEDVTCRTRLLKSMISNLKERSFATKIFVSPCSWASTPLESRDLQPNSQAIMDDLSVDGNTQDLLTYLKSVSHDVCLVTIGFAGITTRSEDIIRLVETNPSLKKIAIETFAQCNQVFIFKTKELVEDNDLLQKFEDRNYFIQRSK